MPVLVCVNRLINHLMPSGAGNKKMGTRKISVGITIERTPKVTVAMSKEMMEALEEERKARKLATIPEVVRIIVSEYFMTNENK